MEAFDAEFGGLPSAVDDARRTSSGTT